MPGLGGSVAGEEHLAHRAVEADRGQRGGRGGVAVEYHRQATAGRLARGAGEGRELQPADREQRLATTERRPVVGNRRFDHGSLALQPGGVEAGTAAHGLGGGGGGQRGDECGGRRRVADPDLAQDEAVGPAIGELGGEVRTGPQCRVELIRAERGSRGHVGGAGGDLGVAHARRRRAEQADIGDQEVVLPPSREDADRRLSSGSGGGHLGGHLRIEEARPVPYVPVVGGADEDTGAQA